MRSLSIAACLVLVPACGGPPHTAVPLKPPNNQLLLGEYERHPPDGTTAIRFRADGSVRLAKTKALLDTEPPLAVGTWTLDDRGTPPAGSAPEGGRGSIDGTKLTLTYDQGACTEAPGDKVGVYTVVVSKIGIHFTKVEDSCARRAAIDGQTWWRLK